MENSKKILITGITGNQGGSLAQHLITKNVELFGLTRNANSKKAEVFKQKGITILEGDMDDPSSYSDHLAYMDTVFLVQSFEQGKESEIKQGKQFIDQVKSQNITHLVYSSVLGADLNTGVPHFESKYVLEKYIKELDLDYTFLRPASFNENYLNPEITKRLQKGKLVMPLNKTVIQQLIGIDDVGKVAMKVILAPETYTNKTLSIATDQKQMSEVADIFGKVMDKEIKYQKLPGLFTRLLMGKDLYRMFKYMNKHNFIVVKDIESIKKEFDLQGDLNSWIKDHFS
jgi:uncharacterized protein YbjT (DUF2867 family)